MASFVVSRVSMEVCIIESLLYREASISRATLVPRLDCHVNSLNIQYHCLIHEIAFTITTSRRVPPRLRSPVFSSSTDSTNSANTNWQTSQDTYNTPVRYPHGS